MKKRLLSVFILACALGVNAQNVGINTTGATPHGSAILDLNSGNSGTMGLLPPKVALTATNVAAPVTSPENGLLVYDTVTNTGTAGYIVSPGFYYWSSASSLWKRLNPYTHVVMSEALQPPTAIAGGSSTYAGGAQTFGYGGWPLAAGWTSATSMPFNTVSNPGAGSYYAPAAQTIYNVSLTGWVLNWDHSAFETDVTVYLMQYALGTADITAGNTNSYTGTSLGTPPYIKINHATTNDYDVEPFSITVSSVTMAKGDILIVIIQSNNEGSYLFYGQAQLDFDIAN